MKKKIIIMLAALALFIAGFLFYGFNTDNSMPLLNDDNGEMMENDLDKQSEEGLQDLHDEDGPGGLEENGSYDTNLENDSDNEVDGEFDENSNDNDLEDDGNMSEPYDTDGEGHEEGSAL